MSKMQMERREKVLVHNREGFAVLAAAALVIALAGFGCESERRAVPGTPASSDGTTGDARTSYTWTTYESPTLGITIPYPEGWYVRDRMDGVQKQVDIHPTALPSFDVAADAVAAVTYLVDYSQGSVSDGIRDYEPITGSQSMVINDVQVTSISYVSDILDDAIISVYLWKTEDGVHHLSGRVDNPVLSMMLSRMLGGAP